MHKKLHVFLCLSFMLGACAITTPEPTPTPVPTSTPMPTPTAVWERAGWEITWHDEFEGTELDLKTGLLTLAAMVGGIRNGKSTLIDLKMYVSRIKCW